MLEQLFGSATRVKLLRLFYSNPDKSYFVRELTRKLEQRINSVRQELQNLEEIGIVEETDKDRKKYYALKPDFPLFQELKSLMVKSQILLERDFALSISRLGAIKFMLLSGMFVGRIDLPTDLLIVGAVDRTKMKNLLQKFQKYFDQDVRYTILTLKEYEYRQQVTDRFLFDILENKHIIIVDRLVKPKPKPTAERLTHPSVDRPVVESTITDVVENNPSEQ
jgi:predicted transcriptional regulator